MLYETTTVHVEVGHTVQRLRDLEVFVNFLRITFVIFVRINSSVYIICLAADYVPLPEADEY